MTTLPKVTAKNLMSSRTHFFYHSDYLTCEKSHTQFKRRHYTRKIENINLNNQQKYLSPTITSPQISYRFSAYCKFPFQVYATSSFMATISLTKIILMTLRDSFQSCGLLLKSPALMAYSPDALMLSSRARISVSNFQCGSFG